MLPYLKRIGRGTDITQAQAHVGDTPFYPMQNYRGLSAIPNPARNNGEDIDNTPRQFRRVVNASGVQDVQIHNGLRWGVARGNLHMPGINVGYLYVAAPIIPGQTRGDAGGFHKRGPSPLNVQAVWQAGPGSQPPNPGGPAQIAGNTIINPMSG
jgi:hypothetical protein